MDDLNELKKLMATMAASLQVIGMHAQATADEVQTLRGTLASIEVTLVKVLGNEARTQERFERVEARLNALEKRQPPAA